MTDPTAQHLYVVQNEFGLIKIGRSIDPRTRLYKIRAMDRCRAEFVAIFEGGGEDEEAIHIALDRFRLEGEWFNGNSAARRAVEKTLGIKSDEWKFQHDISGADKWLDHLRVVRDASYIRSAITRHIGILRTAIEPSWIYDGGIFRCRYLGETGNAPMILGAKMGGETVNAWNNPETKKQEILPAYTKTIEDALLAWPDDLRPGTWAGSSIECCIAALAAIKGRLPKVPRVKS